MKELNAFIKCALAHYMSADRKNKQQEEWYVSALCLNANPDSSIGHAVNRVDPDGPLDGKSAKQYASMIARNNRREYERLMANAAILDEPHIQLLTRLLNGPNGYPPYREFAERQAAMATFRNVLSEPAAYTHDAYRLASEMLEHLERSSLKDQHAYYSRSVTAKLVDMVSSSDPVIAARGC